MAIYRIDKVRLLPDWQDEPIIRPRTFIIHTMVGYLQGTEDRFRRLDFKIESHFGIGGPYDVGSHDGEIRQWQDTSRQADANGAANNFAISVETSDGGDALRPWSPRQVDAIVNLSLMAHFVDRIPLRLMSTWNDERGGFGYHAMYDEWNPNNHSCPARTRIAQWIAEVWPRILRESRLGAEMSLSEEDKAFFRELDAKRHDDMVTLLRGESHASLAKILDALNKIEANTHATAG